MTLSYYMNVFSALREIINMTHRIRSNLELKIKVIILYQQCAETNMHDECVWLHRTLLASTENDSRPKGCL